LFRPTLEVEALALRWGIREKFLHVPRMFSLLSDLKPAYGQLLKN
jgi:hypothetical protein